MVFQKFIINLPTSKVLSYYWNFGSLLGMILVFQLFTGVFLVFFFSNDSLFSFSSVQYIMYEVNFGWVFRLMHFNGAIFFFFFLYLHFFKALFMMSYRLKMVWVFGLFIFLLLMMEAFLGYVIVWAQMSFWASVVITSLLSVIPVYGFDLVFWIWGGFSVSGATLKFFFVLHFLLPWFVLLLVLFHLFFLHNTGSTSKLFCHSGVDKINFFPFFWLKDFINLIVFFVFFVFVFFFPFNLGDPEMFLEADFLNSPVHIVPEWYFLFAYAILRAIPNKILGVFFLIFSIFIFFLFVLLDDFSGIFARVNKFMFLMFFFVSLVLSWLGGCLVEDPFILLSFVFSFLYFFILFFFIFFNCFWLVLFNQVLL